jgi:hypothetical protein
MPEITEAGQLKDAVIFPSQENYTCMEEKIKKMKKNKHSSREYTGKQPEMVKDIKN